MPLLSSSHDSFFVLPLASLMTIGEIPPGSGVTAVQYHPGKYAYDDTTYPGDAA